MKYRNIIFDFDGTLVDTASLIIETMHRTINVLGLPEKTDEECRSMIGYRLEEIPSFLWPEIPDLSERYGRENGHRLKSWQVISAGILLRPAHY